MKQIFMSNMTSILKPQFLWCLLGISILGIGDVLAQESINSAGKDALSSEGSASYSIGQVFYSSYSGANASHAEGVQQSYEFSMSTYINLNELELDITISPNPISHVLNLSIGQFEYGKLRYILSDLSGKFIDSKQIQDQNTLIDLSTFPASTYLLIITHQNKANTLIKIIKN